MPMTKYRDVTNPDLETEQCGAIWSQAMHLQTEPGRVVLAYPVLCFHGLPQEISDIYFSVAQRAQKRSG